LGFPAKHSAVALTKVKAVRQIQTQIQTMKREVIGMVMQRVQKWTGVVQREIAV
jgi:hypothetical protein